MAQPPDIHTREELIRKYRLAGSIRFICFFLLLLFLILMKNIGGYSYVNTIFIALICVEAVFNQPYAFLLKSVNIYRFQYYQMITDIIAISWIIHYMGGLEAPIVVIAYYAVILWAGVVSTTAAVFFAVLVSAICFSAIVLLEHFALIPFVSFFEYKIPTNQMISLLLGNVSFLFAFGYFSAHSSDVIKFLQRKRQEEFLRSVHKLMATGSLMGRTAHDILNQFACIKGYVDFLLSKKELSGQVREMLESIRKLEIKGASLLDRIAVFAKKTDQEFDTIDLHKVIDAALDVCWPLIRYSKMKILKPYGENIPKIMANKGQLQEAFVVFILNALDAVSGQGSLTIKTVHDRKNDIIEIEFSDTGSGITQKNLKHIGEPFFTTKGSGKGLGIGLATAYGIINRHNGRISVNSELDIGTTFTIQLPVRQPQEGLTGHG